MAARHSRVTSSTIFRTRKRRPLANWSWTKSSDHRARPSLDQDRRSGAHGAAAGPALAHAEAFLSIQTVDPVPARRLALLAQQHEQPAVAEPPTGIGKLAQVAA